MSDVRDITELSPARERALAERIHEIIELFKRLRESDFWSVQTFWVRDLGLYLDASQMACVVARIGLALQVASEEKIRSMVVDLSDDLKAGDDEMYSISHYCDLRGKKRGRQKIKENVTVGAMKLQFVTVKRRMRKVA